MNSKPPKTANDFEVADMFWSPADKDNLKPDEMWAKECLRLSKSYNNCDTRSRQLDEFYDENETIDKPVMEILTAVKKQLSQIKCDTFTDRKNDPEITEKDLGVKHDCFGNVSSIEIFVRSLVLLQCLQHRVVAGKGLEYVMYWKDSHETFVENAPSSDGKEKDHSYNHWALFNNNTSEIQQMTFFWKSVLENDMEDLLKAGIIEPIPPRRTHRDNFDRKGMSTIIKLWKLQNGFMRDGEKITYKDLYLKPRKFHIDHVLDRKHGGPTTLDNAELMRAKDNLAKGATANEQPFRGEDVGFNREDDE
jgi:hypothetical protein